MENEKPQKGTYEAFKYAPLEEIDKHLRPLLAKEEMDLSYSDEPREDLPGEDADAFEDLLNQVRAHLSPVGPIEEQLADRVVNFMWRLGRLARAETALFDWRVRGFKVGQLADQIRVYEVPYPTFPPDITDKAAHTEATEALARATHERDQVFLGRALDADAKEGDALGKLARYERSLERSHFATLEELRKLQDRRWNRPSPPILDAVPLAAGDTE
jgi:hypothetical protein